MNNSRTKIKIEIYPGGREGNRQWFWRARRRYNRKIIADGAEGYYKKGNAIRAANKLMDALYDDLIHGGPEIVVLDA